LFAIYQFYKDAIGLDGVIAGVSMLEEGGTLAANLGVHALKNGYEADIFTFNLKVFDPTWFELERETFKSKLRARQEVRKNNQKLSYAIDAYYDFLDLGGNIHFEDLTVDLIKRYLLQSKPIITGLSATYLYKCRRERPDTQEYDDIHGEPTGHFVVLNGIDEKHNLVYVTDPYKEDPYKIDINHLVCAILLGVVTYDANLLIISPKR
jgi:hypothetical protein